MSRTESQSMQRLFLYFITWKTLLFCCAWFSPGIGYDTSTSLLQQTQPNASETDMTPITGNRLFNFVRWDAIYYSQLAQRGHVFEQEWAFGLGLSTPTSFLTNVFHGQSGHKELRDYVLVGVVLSHLSHWLSVVLVWSIAKSAINRKSPQRSSIAFAAAVVHILSPAGIFLSAPYSESLFSFLNMLGFYLYLKPASSLSSSIVTTSFYNISAGVVFGFATMVRSNGILSGLPFLLDAINCLLEIRSTDTKIIFRADWVVRTLSTLLGGSAIAVGQLLPQLFAFSDYCMQQDSQRPWCHSIPPSIYTWVQSHYWNVGFLRYWTISNLPLFLLATPTLYLLIYSGVEGCGVIRQRNSSSQITSHSALRLALPQLILAVLAVTNYHVQVITRLSSGYAYWYIWLATRLSESKGFDVWVRFFVIYGLVQAGLYASFLPPA